MMKITDILTCDVDSLTNTELEEGVVLVKVLKGKCKEMEKEFRKRTYKSLKNRKVV